MAKIASWQLNMLWRFEGCFDYLQVFQVLCQYADKLNKKSARISWNES
jgi:hypothetical protein